MTTAKIEVPNAIVFLFDYSDASAKMPEYIADQLVSVNAQCVSIGTRASADGDVSITLQRHLSEEATSRLTRVFVGTIGAPNRSLAVVTAEANVILEIQVQETTASVEIWVDDDRWPGTIAIAAV